MAPDDKSSRLKDEFRKLDKNGDGTLDFDEICTLLRKGMSSMGHKEVKTLFEAVDKNHNGRIEFDEFVDYIHSRRGSGHGLDASTSISVTYTGTPGPGSYNTDDRPLLQYSRSSSSSIGKGPGHESLAPKKASPGPADYLTNDKVQAHHTHQPSATIGTGPGHVAPGETRAASPGPAAYAADDTKAASCWQAARVTIGHGPGHLPLAARSDSPGPGTYSCDFSKSAGLPQAARATIGHGPGHRLLDPRETTPGPASYQSEGRARIRGGSIGRAPSMEFISAMRQFKESDVNHDGKLEFQEVRALMRKGNPQMKDSDIKAIFGAVDRNGDERIDFNELVDFIVPAGTADTATSRRRLKAAFAAVQPGPGTYNTAVRRDRVRGGCFPKAIRGV